MNRIHSHLQEIDMIGKLADLKDKHCEHALLLTSLIDILIQKGIITAEELHTTILKNDKLI